MMEILVPRLKFRKSTNLNKMLLFVCLLKWHYSPKIVSSKFLAEMILLTSGA